MVGVWNHLEASSLTQLVADAGRQLKPLNCGLEQTHISSACCLSMLVSLSSLRIWQLG